MPEYGLLPGKIRDHLRRCWVIYLIGILILCFINNLVYTMTRPVFSDDETLKIMLVNANPSISDDAYAELTAKLLPEIQAVAPQIQALEFENTVYVFPEDPNSVLMLKIQRLSGYGDIYLADSIAFAVLAQQNALLDLSETELPGWEREICTDAETGETYAGGFSGKGSLFHSTHEASDGRLYLSIAGNTTDKESALAAMPVLAAAITE